MAHVGQEFRFGQGGFLELLIEREQRGVAFDELLLAFAQARGRRRRAAAGSGKRLGVIADTGNELDLVGQLDEIIVGPSAKAWPLTCGILVGGQNDNGSVLGGGMRGTG